MKKLAILLSLLFTVQLHYSQSTEPSPIIFIYDASGSMWGANGWEIQNGDRL